VWAIARILKSAITSVRPTIHCALKRSTALRESAHIAQASDAWHSLERLCHCSVISECDEQGACS
jgi:hypothetical protein